MQKKILFSLLLATILQADSLKELIEVANKNNHIIESKKLAVKSKTKELESSQSANLPTLDIGGFYQSLDERTPMMPGDIYSGYAKISYNIYITKKYQTAKSQKDKDDIIEALKNSSIVHWEHVNLYGEYDFTRSFKKVAKLIAIEDKEMI